MLYKNVSQGFFLLASFTLILAMFGWAVTDIWLASTQWVEVSIVFLLMAIYVKISEADDMRELKKRSARKKK